AGTRLERGTVPIQFTRSRHGVEKEVGWAEEIRQGRGQEREERHASAQERHAEARQERPRRQGEEPQAGDRDRIVRSAQERRESSPEEELAQEELAEEELAQEEPSLAASNSPMRRDPDLPAVFQDGARRAFRQRTRADMFAKRHEQAVDLDPVSLRQSFLKREHRPLG